MTIIDTSRVTPTVTFDLYRDVHKAIRAELFAVTGSAGSIDSSDPVAVVDLAAHVRSVSEFLAFHAHHEDTAIDPVLHGHFPELSERIGTDHDVLDHRIAGIVEMAETAADRAADRRRLVHGVYLELGAFVSAYLQHQDLEERTVMPALENAVGVDAVIGIHQQIIGAIPPEQMASSLAIMLPAMNIDDRTEMLAGMQASAPAEVFAGVLGLAGSVLPSADVAALRRRLGA